MALGAFRKRKTPRNRLENLANVQINVKMALEDAERTKPTFRIFCRAKTCLESAMEAFKSMRKLRYRLGSLWKR